MVSSLSAGDDTKKHYNLGIKALLLRYLSVTSVMKFCGLKKELSIIDFSQRRPIKRKTTSEVYSDFGPQGSMWYCFTDMTIWRNDAGLAYLLLAASLRTWMLARSIKALIQLTPILGKFLAVIPVEDTRLRNGILTNYTEWLESCRGGWVGTRYTLSKTATLWQKDGVEKHIVITKGTKCGVLEYLQES